MWRLAKDGRIQSCELRDDSRVNAGWDVQVFEDGEPLFSRRCPDEQRARYVADAMKQDQVNAGWREPS